MTYNTELQHTIDELNSLTPQDRETVLNAVGLSKNETYNGWTNRETWAFMLHIDNDEGLYTDVYGRAEEIIEDAESSEYLTAQEEAEREIEAMLKGFHSEIEEAAYDSGAKSYVIMLMDIGSEWRINYRECANNIMESLFLDSSDAEEASAEDLQE